MTPTPSTVEDERGALLDRVLVSAFLDHVPDCVYFKDRESRFLAVSQSMVRYFGGATRRQIIGRTDFDFFAPSHARPAYDDEQRIMRTGQAMIGRIERETWPDGRVTWVRSSKLPLRDDHGEIIGTFGISKDITQTREMELALEQAHKDVVDASRLAGMAEVATGVLHNVGNVLNSLNVSASVIAAGLRQSKAESIGKLAALLREHQADLGRFLSEDPKGRRVPEFLGSLARHAIEERMRLIQEVASLQKNIDHIKEIVSMQQAYATMVSVIEPLDAAQVMEDALRMNAGALQRHGVRVERDFQFAPAVLGEKAKVLQILVNLIRNAKYACDEGGAADRRVMLRVRPDGDRVHLVVEDNGVGIPAENLTRIFRHGFTTRKDGHGFGLHSAANAAREMKGALNVHSAGSGQGATFTLLLPVAPPAVPVE
jgi:PAS domain S-box-containing protein